MFRWCKFKEKNRYVFDKKVNYFLIIMLIYVIFWIKLFIFLVVCFSDFGFFFVVLRVFFVNDEKNLGKKLI